MSEKLLKEARDRLKRAIDAEDENRSLSIEDVRFENGEQWPEKAHREREEDGRPCLVINKTAGTVKQIVGDARQNRYSIKVRPVDDGSDPKIAQIFTGIIRNIENISDAESAYDTALESSVRGAWGYIRVITEYASDDAFEQDIKIERVVNPYSVYFDPAAKKPDFSDARWCLVVDTLDRDEFEALYPNSESLDIDQGRGETYNDWFTENAVRVAEYFKIVTRKRKLLLIGKGSIPVESIPPEAAAYVGKTVYADTLPEGFEEAFRSSGMVSKEREAEVPEVRWWKITGAEILEGGEEGREWPGKFIPVIPVLGEEIWIEGKRILRSAIRHAKDPARLYNWARSNAAETLALAPKQPFLLTPEEIQGHEEQWAVAHRKPMPYLLHNATALGRPSRQAASIVDSGAVQEAMMASDDIKATTGLFDAALGAQGNETSGKAIIARQREGDTATFVFTDNLARAIRHVGRILIDLIPKIYDTDRVVRLLNEDGSEGWERVNVEDPMTGRKVNDLSAGKYDLVLSAGPSYSTKRLEAADGMLQAVQMAPNAAPAILPRLAKNLDWPEADDIAEELKGIFQPQGPDPRMQMQMAKGEQEILGKQLDNERKQQEMSMMGDPVQQMAQVAQQVTIMTLKEIGLIP